MPASDILAILTQQLPGAVSIDGTPTRVADWVRTSSTTTAHQVEFSLGHPGGLTMGVTVTTFEDTPAVEWHARLRNDAASDSAVLSQLRPLDLVWEVADEDDAALATINGSLCRLDDFLPWKRAIDQDDPIHLEPVGGRSSDGAMPFFTVTCGSVSLAVGIGWSGQWAADVTRFTDEVRIQAGLAHSQLRLHPGESITLPSILVAAVDGTGEAASNALRAVLSSHVMPHGAGGSPVTPLAHMTMSTFHITKQVSEESELVAVRRAAELGLEAFWVDACWYGETPMWAEQVGNWTVRRDAFPRGLKPISDAAHGAGMKFVLWIEPERARIGTRLVEQQPGALPHLPRRPAERPARPRQPGGPRGCAEDGVRLRRRVRSRHLPPGFQH